MEFKKIEEVNEYKSKLVNPQKNPDVWYELYSIPNYELKLPEIVQGKDIASSKQIVEEGDILISKINPRINRVWIVSNHSKYMKIASSEWIVVRTQKINNKYLSYYFKSDNFKKLLCSQVTGIGGSLTRAQPKNVKNYKVPLLSVDMQSKVVEVLDEIMNVIEKRQSQITALDQLTQSVFLEMFGDPINNPKEWEVKKLKNITNKILSGTTPKGGSKVYIEKGITFFRSQNVWKNRLVLNDVVYIDKETHNKMKKSSLKYGDILMTKTGRVNTENSSLGRAAIFLGKNDSANINGHVYLIRLQKDIINEFILFILTTDEYREYIRRVCVGGIDKRQINKEHLEEFPIISPPIELQVQFSNLLTHVEKLKSEMRTSLNELEDNFNSLLQRAFKGELFTQEKLPNA